MRYRFATAFLLVTMAATLLFLPGAFGQDEGGSNGGSDPGASSKPGTEKLAQTSFKFLSVPIYARAAAMGDATTAIGNNSSVAMFYNPAGMAYIENTAHASIGLAQYIADINYNGASVAYKPADGKYGVFGLSLVSVDYGEVLGTVRANNSQGYVDYSEIGIGNPSPSALAIGLGYAHALTDRVAVGGNVRYANQDLGNVVTSGSSAGSGYNEDGYGKSTVVFDFGIFYKTGFRSLNFAMSARSFSQELQYVTENFELPLTFRIGVAMNLLDFTNLNPDMHALHLGVDAERPRDFAEQVKVGGEYVFMNTLSLRAGYIYPTDERGLNLGTGFQFSAGDLDIGADYAYTRFGVFGNVNRVALDIGF